MVLSNLFKKIEQIFSKNEDYIITNLKDSVHYQTILKSKGKRVLEERENFLKKQ